MANKTEQGQTRQRQAGSATPGDDLNAIPPQVLDDIAAVAAEKAKNAPPLSQRQIDRVVSVLRMSDAGLGEYAPQA